MFNRRRHINDHIWSIAFLKPLFLMEYTRVMQDYCKAVILGISLQQEDSGNHCLEMKCTVTIILIYFWHFMFLSDLIYLCCQVNHGTWRNGSTRPQSTTTRALLCLRVYDHSQLSF